MPISIFSAGPTWLISAVRSRVPTLLLPSFLPPSGVPWFRVVILQLLAYAAGGSAMAPLVWHTAIGFGEVGVGVGVVMFEN
jgi:hypothetical protein